MLLTLGPYTYTNKVNLGTVPVTELKKFTSKIIFLFPNRSLTIYYGEKLELL